LGERLRSTRDDFGMPGVPIRLNMRKAKNPFASRAKKQR
jgi:GTPase